MGAIPLLFQPGTEWNYSVSTDVLGRVVEVASGQTLDVFIEERICRPLGMADTSFWCTDEQADRFAALYVPRPGTRKAVPLRSVIARALRRSSSAGAVVSSARCTTTCGSRR